MPVRAYVFVLLLFAIAGCSPPADAPWQWFVPEDGDFSAEFRGTPEIETSEDGLEQSFTLEYAGGRKVLRISRDRGADTSVSFEERFAGVEEAMDVQGEITMIPITLEGHPGMEGQYTVLYKGERLQMRHRLFHVGDVSYTAMVVHAPDTDMQADAEHFFNAFKLEDFQLGGSSPAESAAD